LDVTLDEVHEARAETTRDAKERAAAMRGHAEELRRRARDAIARSEALRAWTLRTVAETHCVVHQRRSPLS
jgi:hypothetical protein